ncbi:hypothetical protein J4206_06715 [Candidatus Woesearchaeota archaeon]|nr:hypothetical protein [Candidatus Woesearchaeota archaeon]
MAEYNEAQVWSAIHGETHPHVPEDKRTIEGYIPLVDDLFPGINYFSMTGFNQVMRDYVQPALSKLFPDIAKKKAHQVNSDNIVSVGTFLPSEGYEHADSPQWKKKLEALLVQ